MENLPRNLGKDVNKLTVPNPSERARRWTLLFVDNLGKTISIRRFKGLAITSIFFLIILITATVCLYFLFKNEREQNKNFMNTLAQFQQQVVSLKNDKEVLMARLVVAEYKIESSQVKTEETLPERMLDNTALIISSKENESDATDLEKIDLFNKTQMEKKLTTLEPRASVKPAKPLGIMVNKFNIYHKPDINTLIIEFTLRKIGPKTKPVSGDVIVVLKDDEVKMDNWITVPYGAVVSEQLSRKKKGHAFSIYRFVTLKFKVKGETSPDRFKIATVFVFSQKGDLLLKKDFPIEIKSAYAPTPKNYLLCMRHNAR
jgi:hypothetical protein